jgi:hypothetical protein
MIFFIMTIFKKIMNSNQPVFRKMEEPTGDRISRFLAVLKTMISGRCNVGYVICTQEKQFGFSAMCPLCCPIDS